MGNKKSAARKCYCVRHVLSGQILYKGTSISLAAAVLGPGTCYHASDSLADSEIFSGTKARHIRSLRPMPRPKYPNMTYKELLRFEALGAIRPCT
jgi:hypothetical protein